MDYYVGLSTRARRALFNSGVCNLPIHVIAAKSAKHLARYPYIGRKIAGQLKAWAAAKTAPPIAHLTASLGHAPRKVWRDDVVEYVWDDEMAGAIVGAPADPEAFG